MFGIKTILYSIDIINREYCSGWCFHRFFRDTPVLLSFYQNNKLVGETVCSHFRGDLKDQSLHKTGVCGFECVFPEAISGDMEIQVCANNSSRPFHIIRPELISDVFTPQGNSLFFMHIPKTAGTSFNNHIRQYFGYKKSRTHIEAQDLNAQQGLAKTCDYLAGHITKEHIPAIFGDNKNVDLHTILREPLRQLHSHLAWIKGIALNTRSEFFNKHDDVIKTMGQSLHSTDFSSPEALKRFVENLDGFQIDFFDNIQTRYFLDYRPDWVGEKELEKAIDNISHFKTIGTTENYEEYLKEFCDGYGLKYIPVGSVHNPSKVTPLFDITDPEIKETLWPLVRYDIELYRAVIEQKISLKP